MVILRTKRSQEKVLNLKCIFLFYNIFCAKLYFWGLDQNKNKSDLDQTVLNETDPDPEHCNVEIVRDPGRTNM